MSSGFSRNHFKIDNDVDSAGMNKLRISTCFLVLLGVPFLVLLASYLFLSWEHSRLNLWHVVVHENGAYTLAQSIFYFNHFVREIPVSFMTAFAFAASFYLFTPVVLCDSVRTRKLGNYLKILIFIFLGAACIAAICQTNWGIFLLDLGQFKTRDTSVLYGSHWHSHVFHVLWIFFAAGAAACVCREVSGVGYLSGSSYGVKLFGLWLVGFILTSGIFGFHPALTNTRYLAHQCREIVTHSLVTLPLSFAVLMALEHKLRAAVSSESSQAWKKRNRFWGLCSILAGSTVFFWMLVEIRHRHIMVYAQKQSSVMDLLASHFFEHSLDYLFVPLLTGGMFLFFLNVRRPHATLP